MPGNPSAQLGVSTRARRDPQRRVGNANVVASGRVDLSRVAVLGTKELEWIRRLANEDGQDTGAAKREETQRRKQLSDTRRAGWPDTEEARQAEFLRRREKEKNDTEERKRALDVLYAGQHEQQRLDAVARVELQNLKDDPRSRNVKSMLLLHEALKSREEQVEFNQCLAAQQKEDARKELVELQRRAWGETAEEMRKQMEARQRNLTEKEANLNIVKYQIDERRRERAAGVAERHHIEREAMDELQENALEKSERQACKAANGEHNRANGHKAVTKAQRLQQRVRNGAVDEAERAAEDTKLDAIKRYAIDARKKKQDAFEQCKEMGLKAYTAERALLDSPIRRTQDRFETEGTSFLERMYTGDADRVVKMKEGAKRDPADDNLYAAYRRAHATASGYVDAAEERAHLEEMRTYPERVRAEEAAETAARRQEADRVRHIQLLQAQEKKMNTRKEVEANREEARLQRERVAMEDEQFHAYIKSQLPEDMNDVLRACCHAAVE